MGCWNLFSDADVKTKVNKLKDTFKRWKEKPNLMRHTFSDFRYFKKTYEDVTGLDFDFDPLPTMRQLTKLERVIDLREKEVSKTPTSLGKWFKLPGALLDKYPITKQYRRSLGIAGDRYRGDIEKFSTDLDTMTKYVYDEMNVAGAMNKFSLGRSAAVKKIRQLEDQFMKMRTTNEYKAGRFYEKNLSRTALFKEHGTKTLQSFHELIRNPLNLYSDLNQMNLNRPKYHKDIANYSTGLVQAAHLWHSKMAPELFKKLKTGLQNYVDSIGEINARYGGVQIIKENLQDLVKNLKYEKHYVPTQVLQLFPALSKFSQDMYSGKVSKSGANKDVSDYMSDMYESVKENLSLTGHVHTKRLDTPDYMSKDVIGVIDKYVKNVTRFNFTAIASKKLLEATRKLDTIKKGEKIWQYLIYWKRKNQKLLILV